ncbi:MAG: carotenoid biosynthesis protein [Pseudonocardiaceae bacterium]
MIGLPHQAVTGRGARLADALALGLGCAGVAAQICYPLAEGTGRDLVTAAVVLLLAGACVSHATATRGAWWAAGLVLVTTGGGLFAESVGTATGFPFGSYTYTTDGALGPEAGSVPLLIGPAWTCGAYPAWCAAQAVAGRRPGAGTVLAAAWSLASWDLYLDPQMVADGRWVWTDPSPALPGVPAVPLSNYAGWLLMALLLCGALHRLDRALGAPRPAHEGLPLALFCWTWLGSAVAHAVFLGLPASAGYGLVGMGLIGVPLLRTLLRPHSGVRVGAIGESPILPAGPEPCR